MSTSDPQPAQITWTDQLPPGLLDVMSQVAALLRSRTVNDEGAELGTFTPETRPTDAQVNDIIVGVAADLSTEVNLELLPEPLIDSAQSFIKYMTAALVELTYYPEQVTAGRSPYPQLKALADEQLARLSKAAADSVEYDAGVDAGDRMSLVNAPDYQPLGMRTSW